MKNMQFRQLSKIDLPIVKICVILVLVLSMYFLSPLQDGNFKLVMSMGLDRTVRVCCISWWINPYFILKAYSHQAKTESKAKIVFEICDQ